MRTFARKPEAVPKTAAKVIKAIEGLLRYSTENWAVTNITVFVPIGPFKDQDCGELAGAINSAWLDLWSSLKEGDPALEVLVTQVEDSENDLFVGAQNLACDLFRSARCDIMVTLAPSAFEAGYFSKETVDALVAAHDVGAKMMPIMVPEDGIDEFVARGTAGGPIMVWDLKALSEAGGFHPSAAQPKIGEENPNAGTEEIYPMVRIMQLYGSCYAPIMPHGVAFEKRKLEGEDLERHLKQVRTKTDRQLAHAKALGINDLDFFAAHVMPQYKVESVE